MRYFKPSIARQTTIKKSIINLEIKDKLNCVLLNLHAYIISRTREIQLEININEKLHGTHLFLNT